MAGQEMPFAFWSFVVYAVLVGLGLIVGVLTRSPKALLLVVVATMATSIYLWITSYRVKRAILDVPTSKTRSAAQGYVELHGTIESLGGKTLTGPLTRAPCVWYSYNVTEGSGDQREAIESYTASTPFLLRDETGACLVEPRDACVMCDKTVVRHQGNRRHDEWSMREGDSIYAIGLFRTDAVQAHAVGKEAMAQLRVWLRDPKAFFSRFDTDRDGKVSRAELDAANEAARREAIDRYVAQGGKHRLTAPRDGRSFILSGLPHDRVAEFFGTLGFVHVGIFIVSLGVLFAVLLDLSTV